MSELPGEVESNIQGHLRRARSQAAAIEDPSTRRAVEALADAVAELLSALRQPG